MNGYEINMDYLLRETTGVTCPILGMDLTAEDKKKFNNFNKNQKKETCNVIIFFDISISVSKYV